MTVEQFQAELRAWRWKEPFQPFVIELTTGERVVVRNPNGLAFAGGGGAYITNRGKVYEFDAPEVIRVAARTGTPDGGGHDS